MLIILHLILMIIATLCFAAGIGMALFGRKKKFWLKWHKAFNTTGLGLLAAGAVMAVTNVVSSGGQHLAGWHQRVGLIAFFMAAVTLSLGFYSFKAANKATVRTAHRWVGRVAGLVILSALILGLRMIGLF